MLKPDVINEIQDLRYLNWARVRHSSGTAGSYLKAYDKFRGIKRYYKLSCYDSVNGITGHESVNEIIVDRLLTILGIEHLHYQLIHAVISIDSQDHETYLCVSEDFKQPGDSKIALDDYYELEREKGESILSFCRRMGWADYIYRMLVVDYLILNRDRHGANIEILRDSQRGITHPAPLFDHGLSLVYSCRTDEEVGAFDPMDDKPVQSYVGSRSALDNLSLIPEREKPVLRRLEERDRAVLFAGLEEVIPQIYRDKIWEIIWNRWRYYEDI
ncbi:MAG: hypothetical protein IJH95_06290 [Mogibacterium sp.]|nr:hypothetical protein [Mogibacterium sp.]